ncbi:MAG: glycosyltransferase family 2 protein [Terriglobales bacterium]|jgi:polyisoprenyl-phosphate glycosyltransferase
MISVVVPVYNEEEIVPLLHDAVVRAMSKMRDTWEVVYVNDGSSDSTLQLLRALQLNDPNVVVVDLSRNWGHMGAISAGLQTAAGDAVVLMDGDLQDPPEVVPELVEAWRHGAQVVTAVRRSRQERRKALAFLFPLFYRVLGALSDFPIPLNAGIFGLMDRRVVDSINALSEGNRYLPGLRAWVGYRTAIVYYDRNDRIGGEGKLSFISRIKYAMDAITSFSYKPLRFSFVLSGLSLFASFVLMITALVSAGPLNPVVYGMTAAVFFVGSLVLLSAGIMGEYIGRVYDEVRHRPLSIIAQVYSAVEAGYRAQPARPIAVKSNGQNGDLERISPAV